MAAPPPQYGVLPPQLYGEEYGAPQVAYNQYGVAVQPQAQVYGMPPGATGPYNPAYPPPGWGVNGKLDFRFIYYERNPVSTLRI